MAKRKPDPEGAAQMDMFGGWIAPANEQRVPPAPDLLESTTIKAANDQIEPLDCNIGDAETLQPNLTGPESAKVFDPPSQISISPVKPPNNWESDEWWTTAMVCAYLKLGRKAIWERTRHPTIGFPQPTHFGSCHHRWRAGEVKAWASLQG